MSSSGDSSGESMARAMPLEMLEVNPEVTLPDADVGLAMLLHLAVNSALAAALLTLECGIDAAAGMAAPVAAAEPAAPLLLLWMLF